MFYIEGENIKYEILPYKKGKKVIIYLKKTENGFVRKNKCFGTHYLEQIFDYNNKLLKETIYENPNFVDLTNFPIDLDYD
ncbi:hypothetical protein mru_1664 [Methanobrevibacter ruminantium M1]|uniref:Uncharacterized protein n=1 Tax=Methanobrevibacter ruminantium (strain ATCC 35063 / DSM 1093 / JCM 13430 / OCM 146 / M1) TaxID=634498 RepID=D3DYW4_METRM|nr:hypothetical protein [Methanobrevibacter ruminantium]ADC47514.1 hypothetical protein mru_1664 [Methanobrevibacter ruminantium M1]